MAEFLVKMADERGHVLEQMENGSSAQEIRDRFAQQGFMVYSIKGQGGALGLNLLGQKEDQRRGIYHLQPAIPHADQGRTAYFKSLDLLSAPAQRSFQSGASRRTAEGAKRRLLSDAFAAQGNMSKIYTTTLLAGERSGNLEEVLGRFITFQRVAMTFRKKMLSSLWYPALLFVALGVMLTFLMTYVVPQFADLYSSLDAKLPATTVFMLGVGKAIQAILLDICSPDSRCGRIYGLEAI